MDKKEKLEEQKKINQFKQFLVSFNSNNNINNDDYNINKKKEEEQETRDAKAFLQQRIPEVKKGIKYEIDFHTKSMFDNLNKELSQLNNKK